MICEAALAACATCAELWQAGNGARHGEAHGQRGAAGQQVGSSLQLPPWVPPSPLSHALCSPHQVSGRGRESRVDSARQHRVQRQL